MIYTPSVYAGSVSITEINYDLEGGDSSREWIEIYNNTGIDIDLTKYKFVESGSSHNIAHYEGDINLPNNAYAIVADNPETFLIDNPSFSKTHLYDSSFSLSNNGEALAIKDTEGNIIFEVTYDASLGASGTGKSLQINSSSIWISANPTPGAILSSNTNVDNQNTQTQNNLPTSTTGSNSVNIVKITKEPVMQFVFDVPKSVIAGTNTIMKTKLLGYSGETINQGLFVWNFGDGQTINLNTNTNVEHSYLFPGTYTVSCSYFYGSWYGKPVIVGRTKIEVIESPLTIKQIYTQPYPALRISNDGDNEYDISNYIIQTNNTNITIPVGTYIGENDDIVIVLPNQTLLDGEIKLLSPLGYTNTVFNKNNINKTSLDLNNNINNTLKNNQNTNFNEIDFISPNMFDNANNIDSTDQIINLDDSVVENPKNNKSIYLQFFLIIVFASFLLVFLRLYGVKKNTTKNDDYALQDE